MSRRGSTFQKYRTRKRYDQPGHAHFLTFSCWNHLPLLRAERSCLWFLSSLQSARQAHPIDLWAWVLMPDHVHLLLLPRQGTKVGAFLKSCKQRCARNAIHWVRTHCPWFLDRLEDRQPSGRRSYRFWQPGGGYDRNIWTADELHEKIQYIHNNPVRSDLVQQAIEWRWSSLRAWETGRDEPIPIDRESLPPRGT